MPFENQQNKHTILIFYFLFFMIHSPSFRLETYLAMIDRLICI